MQILTTERAQKFFTLTDEQLKAGLVDNAYRKDNESRRWFSQFKFAHDAVNGNPHHAIEQGLGLLKRCKSLDEAAYKEIHKGGAFYWLGVASYLVNDFEMATFFMDAAVSEDLRWGGENKTPAMLFMQLDGENDEQAAKQLTKRAQDGIEGRIADYIKLSGASTNIYSVQTLRERLFIPSIDPTNSSWRSIATAFISFALEWEYRNLLLDVRTEQGTFEPFYIHLFKGCLLFESLLKENPTKKPSTNGNTLNTALNYLKMELGIQGINGNGNKTLNDVLGEVDKYNVSITHSILIAYMTRNTLGHNLGWGDGITKTQYQQLYKIIASSCLHVIACLYK